MQHLEFSGAVRPLKVVVRRQMANQLDAQNFCFTISLFHASTYFQHHALIMRRSKLHYTASGIITPVGGRPVHRLREDSLSTGWPPTGVMIPDAV